MLRNTNAAHLDDPGKRNHFMVLTELQVGLELALLQRYFARVCVHLLTCPRLNDTVDGPSNALESSHICQQRKGHRCVITRHPESQGEHAECSG